MKPRDGPAAELMETDMPAKTKTSASKPLVPGRSPTHRLYRVQGDGDAAIWTPIGAAWPNKDGKGFSLTCDAVPLAGRLVLRTIAPRADAARGQQ
jgi:hypothetical protein